MKRDRSIPGVRFKSMKFDSFGKHSAAVSLMWNCHEILELISLHEIDFFICEQFRLIDIKADSHNSFFGSNYFSSIVSSHGNIDAHYLIL